jgi:SAM-dependent methyltransferase
MPMTLGNVDTQLSSHAASPITPERVDVRIMADIADPYDLYIASVQNPELTVKQCSRLFQEQIGSTPAIIREDFCGTAAICHAWVREHESARVFGVDHDNAPLTWCRNNLLPQLSEIERERVDLICSDVRSPSLPGADLILALNCSFCVFKKRSALIDYFRSCRKALGDQGMLVLEVYAGPEAQMIGSDIVHCQDFTAVWEQARFNAVTNETTAHLHFQFSDGSEIRKAFSYDWRLWSPAELVEALRDAGFAGAEVYASDFDQNKPVEPCSSASVPVHWTVYLAGWTRHIA